GRRLRRGREIGHPADLLGQGQARERFALGRSRQLLARAAIGVHGAVEVVAGLEGAPQAQRDLARRAGDRRRLLEQGHRARAVSGGGLLLRLFYEVLRGHAGRRLGGLRRLLLLLVLLLVRGDGREEQGGE